MKQINGLSLAIFFAVLGCGKQPSKPMNELWYDDDLDRGASIKRDPLRIVSLSPTHTEMLFALGAGDRVVGVTAYCNYPAEAKTKTNVGGPDSAKLSLETILSLKPDLVLADSGFQKQVVESLARLGVPVLAYEANSIEKVKVNLLLFERIVGHTEASRKMIETFEYDAKSRSVGRYPDPPTVLYLAGEQPVFAAGGGSFTNELIERAGGKNLFADIKDKYPNVSEEEILRRNPDVIVLARPVDPDAKRKELLARPTWQKLKAIQNQRIVFVDEDMASRPGPRILDAIRELENALHPKTKP